MPSQPIVLAVTGHRDLAADDPRLSRLVRRECRRLAERHPGTAFLVLSGLAEGADRLVAEAAMSAIGARLIAVLALPPAAFAKDFATTASRTHFARLLAQAQTRVEAPLLAPAKRWPARGEARNRQYAWAGAYLARNADVLFALWDGSPSRGTGGTAEVVGWFRSGKAPRLYRNLRRRWRRSGPPRRGLLVHIEPGTGSIKRTYAAVRDAASR